MIASLSHLKALCLHVTSDALNNCLFSNEKQTKKKTQRNKQKTKTKPKQNKNKNKTKKRNIVLFNNITQQREALIEWPIRLPLNSTGTSKTHQIRQTIPLCVRYFSYSPNV